MEPTENNDPITGNQVPLPEPETPETTLWMWIRYGLVVFFLILFYIYNQHHANKALRKKEMLTRELKDLRSEKISLESEVTNASRQSEIAAKLKEAGLKELTKPPVKIEHTPKNK